ncbi:TIGR02147 family protein [Bdellovibrio sp. 22V]|uniref:TIGR02147 family protein n=1 Tax=Bdellovibrio TaxID=958 RepID=UPI0025437BF2|nr:TIGR02147 family protein [Bdellovibrio sp. 22V]WII71294.1 TIGR02147 family protein [Bdellovibrio sp. 22V]
MSQKYLNYRSFLVNELEIRKKRNPSYSLRAFARDLAVPVSRLSEVINGKVGLSEERAVKIAERLGFSDSDKELFINLVLSEHARSTVIRNLSIQRVQQRNEAFTRIGEDEFKLVSDWHNIAILELLQTPSIEFTPDFIAKRLGINANLVMDSLERLERLKLIVNKNGVWEPTHMARTTTPDIPQEAVRSYHKQVISKALVAIDKQPMEMRDFSSIMLSINKEKLPFAKDRLRQFRRQLMAELETDPVRDSVYCMNFQLFEITES